MDNVLTTKSKVGCGHPPPPPGAGVVAVESEAKLTVNGAPVLLAEGIDQKQVSSLCGIVPSSTTKKCTKVTGVTAGPATKLKVGGDPVILTSLAGSTDGILTGGNPEAHLAGVAAPGEKLRSA